MSALKVFLVAGEASGDKLGGALIAGLRALRPDITVAGVGGEAMTAQGLQSLFPMRELSVMGVAEILPRLPKLLRRINQTAQAVIAQRPDVLITIDSPDFGLRVAKRVKSVRPDIRTVHYVAPSVWAWRPKRAIKMARCIDHVLALLPFEPPYMHAAGMSCDFVGHPIVAEPQPSAAEVTAYRAKLGVNEGQKLLAVLPGSRRGEVKRLGPVFRDVCAKLEAGNNPPKIVIPAVPHLAEVVAETFRDIPHEIVLPDIKSSDPNAEKRQVFAAADAALAASGTVSLELAAAGTPMVIAYDFNWLTRFIVRRMVKLNSATLVNILTNTNAVPEFIFEDCAAEKILPCLQTTLQDPRSSQAQLAAAAEAMKMLGQGGEDPGLRAARSVLDFIKQ